MSRIPLGIPLDAAPEKILLALLEREMIRDFTTAREALIFAKLMRAEYHAVALDATYDSENKFLSARVTHFLTCFRCAEIQREAERKSNHEKELGKSPEVPTGAELAR